MAVPWCWLPLRRGVPHCAKAVLPPRALRRYEFPKWIVLLLGPANLYKDRSLDEEEEARAPEHDLLAFHHPRLATIQYGLEMHRNDQRSTHSQYETTRNYYIRSSGFGQQKDLCTGNRECTQRRLTTSSLSRQ